MAPRLARTRDRINHGRRLFARIITDHHGLRSIIQIWGSNAKIIVSGETPDVLEMLAWLQYILRNY
jgi:hypothetical protein